jgi:hypothetical protein
MSTFGSLGLVLAHPPDARGQLELLDVVVHVALFDMLLSRFATFKASSNFVFGIQMMNSTPP